MDITFRNMTVTVDAESPEAAYDRLCEALGAFEFTTDTYSAGDGKERATDALFPPPGSKRERVAKHVPEDWEAAVDDLESLLNLLDEIDAPAAEDFVESVREQAESMKDWIQNHHRVTPDQQRSILNWSEGASRWIR